jgi:hypothetical protein
MPKKRQPPEKKEPKFETTFGELMARQGIAPLPEKKKSKAVTPESIEIPPMGSRDRGEIQQLLDTIAQLQQQRRDLQDKLRSQEQTLMTTAEEIALLREKLRNQEAVRQQDLKLMVSQRQELVELRQSNLTLRSQRDALQRRLDVRPKPEPEPAEPEPEPEGSDVRQAAWALSAALRDLSIDRLLIVGGSPSYHIQLQELFGGALDLRLIDGTARRNLRQARADVQWADLAVVWGGTILDHRLSELYTGEAVVLIPHRGIVGMMRQLTESLSS